MDQVSKAINLFNEPVDGSGFIRQIVSFDDKLHQENPEKCMSKIMDSMFIQADADIIKRADSSSRFPTVRDIPWESLEENLKEVHKDDLYLWGEDTRIAERLWHYEGQEIAPVVMRTDKGQEIAYQSSGRDVEKEVALLKSMQEKFGSTDQEEQK